MRCSYLATRRQRIFLSLGLLVSVALVSSVWLYFSRRVSIPVWPSGVVVDSSVTDESDSGLDLREGDILLSWSSRHDLALKDAWKPGPLLTPFEWRRFWLEVVPRGGAVVQRVREGEKKEISIPVHLLEPNRVRPQLPPPVLSDYLAGRARIQKGEVAEGVGEWKAAASRAAAAGDRRISCWLYWKAAIGMSDAEQWDQAERLCPEPKRTPNEVWQLSKNTTPKVWKLLPC